MNVVVPKLPTWISPVIVLRPKTTVPAVTNLVRSVMFRSPAAVALLIVIFLDTVLGAI